MVASYSANNFWGSSNMTHPYQGQPLMKEGATSWAHTRWREQQETGDAAEIYRPYNCHARPEKLLLEQQQWATCPTIWIGKQCEAFLAPSTIPVSAINQSAQPLSLRRYPWSNRLQNSSWALCFKNGMLVTPKFGGLQMVTSSLGSQVS